MSHLFLPEAQPRCGSNASIESPTLNTAPRVRNAFSKSLNIHGEHEWKSAIAIHEKDRTSVTNVFGLNVSTIESLETETLIMSTEDLNFWLSKCVKEARNKNGKNYSEKTIIQVICCIKRYYEGNGRVEMNTLNKENPIRL